MQSDTARKFFKSEYAKETTTCGPQAYRRYDTAIDELYNNGGCQHGKHRFIILRLPGERWPRIMNKSSLVVKSLLVNQFVNERFD